MLYYTITAVQRPFLKLLRRIRAYPLPLLYYGKYQNEF